MWTTVVAFFLALPAVQAQSYTCSKTYTPKRYIGFRHVPTQCRTTTPSACQRSWKPGVPEGKATSKPLIYSPFIFCHESYASCGYVPIDPKTGLVLGGNGVTIGTGVDLGKKNKNSPVFRALPRSLVAKLEPYFGLRQDMAACAAIERPLSLYSRETLNLTNTMIEYAIEKVELRYNMERMKRALPFISLPRGIRTALVSVWFQFGHPEAYPTFWKYVKQNHWEQAVKTLRNFYKNPSAERIEDLRRRHDEADIIEATLMKCNRAIDAVLLLDESGSVSDASFYESLAFVKNMTAAFPDTKLRGKHATRLGLSTFSNVYTPHFYLSNYTSKSQYLSAVDGVSKGGGTTSLGYALARVADQFTETRGLRNEKFGVPRVLIVLTDGRSHDAVNAPARRLREKNVVIYAIGVGKYDISQLRQVASSPKHAYTLSGFFELETFIATLTATTCNQPQPVMLLKRIEMTSDLSNYQYFVYKARRFSLLQIRIKDISGQTLVYASRTNPHPYKYDNDVGFKNSGQKNKVIVIALRDRNNSNNNNNTTGNNSSNTVKRSVEEEENLLPIYVSVLANTEKASFTIEGEPCSPVNCTEGTNEDFHSSAFSYKSSCSVVSFLLVPLFVFYFG